MIAVPEGRVADLDLALNTEKSESGPRVRGQQAQRKLDAGLDGRCRSKGIVQKPVPAAARTAPGSIRLSRQPLITSERQLPRNCCFCFPIVVLCWSQPSARRIRRCRRAAGQRKREGKSQGFLSGGDRRNRLKRLVSDKRNARKQKPFPLPVFGLGSAGPCWTWLNSAAARIIKLNGYVFSVSRETPCAGAAAHLPRSAMAWAKPFMLIGELRRCAIDRNDGDFGGRGGAEAL